MAGRLVAALAVAAGLVLARPGPLTASDQEQPRLDRAAPLPRGAEVVTQTFIAARNGLSAVELLAVVYDDAPPGAPLTLRLNSADGRLIAAATFTGLVHNAPLRLSFAPQPDSAGQTYALELSGGDANGATVWAYSLDGYARGELRAADRAGVSDLRFTTTYTYLPADILRDAFLSLLQLARAAAPLWLVLFAPGFLLLQLLPARLRSRGGRIEDWGLALALSLSSAPLLWQWFTVIGLRWTPERLNLAYGLIGAAAVVSAFLRWRGRGWRWPAVAGSDLALVGVVVVSVGARLLAVRDLALPAWVDSPHHFVVARLLMETGQVPASYAPLLPVQHFTYHFGFHGLAVAYHWLTAQPLTDVFLFLGQVLNGLAPVSVAAFIVALTRRPGAAVVGAGLVGLVSLFPAYYVSWGRYTQLAGLVVLAPLLGATWRLVGRGLAGAWPRWVWLVLVACLASGLVFTHYRVLGFYATFAWAALAAGRRRGWKWLGGAAALAAGCSWPWLWRLWEHWLQPILREPGQLASPQGYNSFPVQYFQNELDRAWIAFGLLALAWGLWRRERPVWVMAGWLAVTFALLNIGPGSWLVNNNSWAISLFVPGALLVGWGAERLWALAGVWSRRRPAHAGLLLIAVLAGLAAALGLRGLRGQVLALNPLTVLATPDDRAALAWVADHTPAEAVFLTNSWRWQVTTWSGPDGGAWVWPLTGRRTTMPPLDYWLEPTWEPEVRAFNERLAALRDADSPEALALLQDGGVTHVFIGARGGVLKPEMFVGSPRYRLLYSNGAAWVFALVNP